MPSRVTIVSWIGAGAAGFCLVAVSCALATTFCGREEQTGRSLSHVVV